jgi:hypothetical protein
MEWNGTFLNGVIVPDDPNGLVEGARVRISLPEPSQEGGPRTLGERLMALSGLAKGLPPDMAEEHNHYIRGTPRRQPKRHE